MATTLLLDRGAWDACIDASGNIAMASEPYSQVQDVASECRLFVGEAYYDTARGIPYWSQILGKLPPISLVKGKLVAAAMLVPGVISTIAYLTSARNRTLSGQIQVKTSAGTQIVAL